MPLTSSEPASHPTSPFVPTLQQLILEPGLEKGWQPLCISLKQSRARLKANQCQCQLFPATARAMVGCLHPGPMVHTTPPSTSQPLHLLTAALQRGQMHSPRVSLCVLKNSPSPQQSPFPNPGTVTEGHTEGVNAAAQPQGKVPLASTSSLLHLPQQVPVPRLGARAWSSPGSCQGTRR